MSNSGISSPPRFGYHAEPEPEDHYSPRPAPRPPTPAEAAAILAQQEAELKRREAQMVRPPASGIELAQHCSVGMNLKREEFGVAGFSNSVAHFDADRLSAAQAAGWKWWGLLKRDGVPVKVVCGKGPNAQVIEWTDAVDVLAAVPEGGTVKLKDGDPLNLRAANLEVTRKPGRPKSAPAAAAKPITE